MEGGFFLSAKLLAVPALFALVLTLLLAPLLLALYRARVSALMGTGTGGHWGAAEAASAGPAPPWQVVDLTQPGGAAAGPWQAAARRGRWRIALAYGAAGLATGLCMTATFAAAFRAQ
jgi:hypothetical protein